jgi:uncharacterized membrane protein YbaN (DUF454 family)
MQSVERGEAGAGALHAPRTFSLAPEFATRAQQMTAHLHKKWSRLRGSRPGRRFQNYYRRSRRESKYDEKAPRIVRLGVAIGLFWIGVFLVVFPLIYVPFFVTSAAIMASESLPFARFLDRSELAFRRSWTGFQQRHGLSHRAVHMIIVTVSLGCLALTGCVCYNTFVR